jgi:hypothetical protein
LDHCLESEFYEGQIECVFTPSSLESRPFRGRSAFLEACWSRFGVKIAHLDKEVLDLASSLVSCAAVIARAGHSLHGRSLRLGSGGHDLIGTAG